MRLFVALTPPAEVVGELAVAVAAVRGREPGLRWAGPENWHLTLAFLGEVDDRTRTGLVERLGRAARRHPPCRLSLGAGGRFGDRVLWARVLGDTDALGRLAGSVRAAARRSGLAVDERPYRAHLTLARPRGRDDRTGVRSAAAQLADFAGREWTAEELHLVHSRLGAGPGGTAVHQPLVSWPLGRS